MKCFAAHYLYPGQGELLTKQVICFDESGTISSIKPLLEETQSTVFLNGLICTAFGLPGNDDLLTVEEATNLLARVRAMDPLVQIDEILPFYTSNPELKVGMKADLWCIEPLDLKKLLLLEESKVYTVFP